MFKIKYKWESKARKAKLYVSLEENERKGLKFCDTKMNVSDSKIGLLFNQWFEFMYTLLKWVEHSTARRNKKFLKLYLELV